MDAVTICANGNFCIARCELPSMHAGAILRELIGTERWIVLSNVGSVGVTLATEFRNLLTRDFAFEASPYTHGLIEASRIATMATHTGKTFPCVNVGGKHIGTYF
jgi:hypothetical protein